MKIEDLKLLDALFLELNLTKVSTRFNIGQSNLSKIVKKIEEELGFPLFERKGFQGLQPTPQGLLLSERIQKFSRSWDDALFLIRNGDEQRTDIKVTGPSLYMRNVFMRRWFASSLPERYRLVYVQTRMDHISLTAKSADIDVLVTHLPSELDEWVPVPVFSEKFAVFSSIKRPIEKLADLKMEDKFWVAYRASDDALQLFFRQNQISQERVTAYLDDVESILDTLADSSKFLAVLPTHADNGFRKLQHWEIPGAAGQTLFLMHRRGSVAGTAAIREIRKIMA